MSQHRTTKHRRQQHNNSNIDFFSCRITIQAPFCSILLHSKEVKKQHEYKRSTSTTKRFQAVRKAVVLFQTTCSWSWSWTVNLYPQLYSVLSRISKRRIWWWEMVPSGFPYSNKPFHLLTCHIVSLDRGRFHYFFTYSRRDKNNSLQTDPPSGVTGAPMDTNIMMWQAVIFGPDDTPWEGGTFKLVLEFTEDYPNKAPQVRFLTKMFHPNIYNDGQICLDILQNQWSPIYDISAILTSIQSLLCDPNPASPANSEASRLYNENRREYNRRVREIVEQSWQDES